MGNCLADGRYFNSRSRQRFTVGLLHAMTTIAATKSFAAELDKTVVSDCFSFDVRAVTLNLIALFLVLS